MIMIERRSEALVTGLPLKKLSQARRMYLWRRCQRNFRLRTSRSRRDRRPIPGDANNVAVYVPRRRLIPIEINIAGKHRTGFAQQSSPMPAHLCFEENYEETAKCLEMVRSNLAIGEARQKAGEVFFKTLPNFMDFATIRKCSPSAALVMAAEFDKSRAVRPFEIPLINLHRWDRRFTAMLDEIGFFRLLGIPRPRRRRVVVQSVVLPFQTGSLVARDEAASLTDTMKALLTRAFPNIDGVDDFELTLMRLLGAIQEATENSCDHAYRLSTVPEVNRRWWATGAINVEARHLNLVVYDQGHSIPATLPTWDKYPFVASRLARFIRTVKTAMGEDALDAVKMRLAMDAPRSSTNLSYRGKGFVLFRQVVEQSASAQLRIVSRNGEFLYRKGARPKSKALATALNGTLVEWDLWL